MTRNNGGQRQWNNIFKMLKEKNLPRILCPAKLSFKNEGKIYSQIKQKLREFVDSRTTL